VSEPLLQIAGLRKAVPGGRVLFSGLDLDVAPGELVAITGESGAGKSTLLNLTAGLDEVDDGTIRIAGAALGPMDEAERAELRRRAIGFVFQAFHILPHLTLGQNVALPLVLLREPIDAATARATALLDAVGLAGRARDFPSQLSGGELQRVAIARAIAHRPALILADEPTGNLDPETAARVMALLVGQIREAGAAAILVTHSEAAAAAADHVLRLTTGGLVPA
jgi:putative ABC transport system ATP-binding protein